MKCQLIRVLVAHILMLIPLAGALAVSPAQAQQEPAEKIQPPAADANHAQEINKAYFEQLRNGSLMIGHMSLALMALEHGVLDVAGKDVDEALKLARTLEKSVPEFKSKDSLRFGKLIHEEENTTRVFYIPIVDESFMVHGLDTRGGEREKIRETDARMVHAHVSLDIRKAVSGLTDAKAALEKKDAKAAEQALTGIMSATVGDEVIVNDPLHVTHDNLILAANLLREERYDSARFALKYARKDLGDYSSRVHDPARKQHVEQMRKEIDALSDRLRKEDPTTLQKTEDTVKGWGAKVKKWFDHPAPEPGHIPEPQSR
ncbi:MAG: YfdX family protein [Gammaproteobacteria bacterium]|nr:YfdX family protein [Gammaproteobacteria bacterium]